MEHILQNLKFTWALIPQALMQTFYKCSFLAHLVEPSELILSHGVVLSVTVLFRTLR